MASKGIAQSLGDLFFTIAPDTSMFQKELTKGLEVAAAGTAANVGAAMESLGMSMVKKFTAPLALATAANIAQFQALDREIRSVLTLFDTAPTLLDETWDQMSAGITQVSRDIGGLEKDIADGLYQAISAGVPEGDVFAFLDVAQMAAIADKTSDLTTAVDAITTITNSFTAEAIDAATASDILFAAVAQGKTTFGELGASIGRAAGTAANAGVKAAEFGAAIATITQTGIQTSEAVSYLRASITGLLRPSEDMNAIFQDMGYASAEAAVPIIGLQPAFQAVVDAAGGSTSRLQELIGTAEGVSAILSITGEKSDAFAKSLMATEQSAGATARAFEIVDGGVGRSFGKLTEAFDRLGNYFGKLGSKLAQPFVDFVTDIVNRIYDIFKALEPAFTAIINAVLGMLSVFNSPIIKQFVAAILSIGLAIGGVLGVMGPFILAAGKMIVAIVKFTVIKRVTQLFKQFRDVAVTAATHAGTAYDKLSKTIQTKLAVAQTTAGKAGAKAATALSSAAVKAGVLSVAFIGVAAAVGLAIFAFDQYRKDMEKINKQTDITIGGVDRLADSLGITLAAIGEVDLDNLDGEFSLDFRVKNLDLLQTLEDTYTTLGKSAVRDRVLGIALEFKNRNATVSEIEAVIAQIEAALNIDLDIGFEDLDPSVAFRNLNTSIAVLKKDFSEAFSTEGFESTYAEITPKLKGGLSEIATQLTRIYSTQGQLPFEDALRSAESQIGGFVAAENYLADELLKSFDELGGGGLEFDIGNMFSGDSSTLEGALDQIKEKFDFAEQVQQVDVLADSTGVMANKLLQASQARLDNVLPTPEQLSVQEDLIGGIGDAFIEAETHIANAFSAVHNGLVNSMPLLDIYTGAVTQSFAKWKEGQDQFQTDIVKVAEFREQLKGLAPEVVGAFDQTSLDKQTWLANLGADEQAEAIAEMAESYSAVTDAVDITWKQEVPGVIQEAQGIIESAYASMYGEALTAGGQVGVNFAAAFDAAAAQWPGIASYWMGQVAAVIGGGAGGAVQLGGPEIQATFNVTNNQVQVTSTTPSPGKSVSQALQQVPG